MTQISRRHRISGNFTAGIHGDLPLSTFESCYDFSTESKKGSRIKSAQQIADKKLGNSILLVTSHTCGAPP